MFLGNLPFSMCLVLIVKELRSMYAIFCYLRGHLTPWEEIEITFQRLDDRFSTVQLKVFSGYRFRFRLLLRLTGLTRCSDLPTIHYGHGILLLAKYYGDFNIKFQALPSPKFFFSLEVKMQADKIKYTKFKVILVSTISYDNWHNQKHLSRYRNKI